MNLSFSVVGTVCFCTSVVAGAAPTGKISKGKIAKDAKIAKEKPLSNAKDERPITAEAMLEKTIFKIDVLKLTLTFRSPAAREVVGEVTQRPSGAAARRRLAKDLVATTDVVATVRFVRDVGLGRFVEGVCDSMKQAIREQYLQREEALQVCRQVPAWFAQFERRGFREGDQIRYEGSSKGMVTRVFDSNGNQLMEQFDEGSAAVRQMLSGYLNPSSDFFDALMSSLWKRYAASV